MDYVLTIPREDLQKVMAAVAFVEENSHAYYSTNDDEQTLGEAMDVEALSRIASDLDQQAAGQEK